MRENCEEHKYGEIHVCKMNNLTVNKKTVGEDVFVRWVVFIEFKFDDMTKTNERLVLILVREKQMSCGVRKLVITVNLCSNEAC